jgi:hypothetical protein
MGAGLIAFSFGISRTVLPFAAFRHLNVKLVFLVTAQVGVGHEIQRVTVASRPGCPEVQDELRLLLERETLDGELESQNGRVSSTVPL